MRSARAFRTFAMMAVFAFVTSGCDSTTEPSNQLLRVRNIGTRPIGAVRVGFPEASAEFGDIAVGATTAYQQTVGVYGYAAYRYTYGGKVRFQPVLDFVGSVPEKGSRFTYNVALVGRTDDSLSLQLQSLTRDK